MISLSVFTNFVDYVQSLKMGQFLQDRFWQPLLTHAQSENTVALIQYLFYVSFVLCCFGLVARLFLGNGSGFTQAVIAAQNILLTYLVAIALYALMPVLRSQLYELPFIAVTPDSFTLRDMFSSTEDLLSGGLLRLAVFSVIVNLLNELLPKTSKPLPWLMWRMATSMLAMALYSFLFLILGAAFGELLNTWGVILVFLLWSLVILVGLLRALMNITLANVPKRLESLYTFFYSRDKAKVKVKVNGKEQEVEKDKGPGKVLTKSIYSSLAVLMVLLILNQEGISTFLFSAFPLVTYCVSLIVVVLTTYLFVKLF